MIYIFLQILLLSWIKWFPWLNKNYITNFTYRLKERRNKEEIMSSYKIHISYMLL